MFDKLLFWDFCLGGAVCVFCTSIAFCLNMFLNVGVFVHYLVLECVGSEVQGINHSTVQQEGLKPIMIGKSSSAYLLSLALELWWEKH